MSMRAWRTRAAVLAAVLLLATEAGAQFGPTPVYTEPVEQRSIRRTVEIVGLAEARRRAVIGAETAGRVQTLDVDAGDYLETDGVLCKMRTTPVRLQLERAKARLASTKADLAKMEAGYRKEDIEQARARVAAAEAEVARWEQEYERTKTLLADGASTQAEMDATEAAYRTAQEKLTEAKANLALLEAGFRTEDVAKARAEVAAQDAAVAELADTLEKMTVRMPFTGFVVRKMTEVGEWLAPGAPVAEVVDLEVVRVQLDVPEKYLPALERRAEAPVTFRALGPDREFTGRISQIVPASALGTHTVMVRVDVPNEISGERPAIAAGLFARVWLPVGPKREALLVPKAAVVRQGGRDVVYTVRDDPPPSAETEQGGGPAGGAPAAEDDSAGEANAGDGEGGGDPSGGSEAAAKALGPVKYAVRVPIEMVGGYGRYMEVRSERLKPGMPVVTRGTYLMEPGVQVRPTVKEQGKGPREPEGGETDGGAAERGSTSLSPGGRGQAEGDETISPVGLLPSRACSRADPRGGCGDPPRAVIWRSPSPRPSPVKGEGVAAAGAGG
jgi:multidrug efflux pump subunit AcrA (membrane-fusion protein)